ncbi:MAG: hypothetical protein ACK2UK_13300 [Candidatus Promineifilaceae bacterium]
MPDEKRSKRFERKSLLVAAAALLLLLVSSGQMLYRSRLPTDGWDAYTTEIDPASWVYYSNLVGADSLLQPGDELLQVDDISVVGTAALAAAARPPGWELGGQVQMLLRRGEDTVSVEVPVVAWTAAAFWRYNAGSLSQAAETVGGLLFLAIGWFTFLRRPTLPSARALLIFSTAVGATFISGLLPDGPSVQFDPAAFALTAFFSYIIFGVLIAPSLLAFTLVFPHPKAILARHPALLWLPLALGIVVFIAVVPLQTPVAGWMATLLMIAASILSLIHSAFTQRDAVSRAQLRWAIGGLVTGLALFALNFPVSFGLVTNLALVELLLALAGLSFVVIGLALGVAILRFHLFDIDVIIRKTLQYGLLTAVLAGVYFGLVLLTQAAFVALTGEQSPLAVVLSTLVIAALFNPLRRRIQAFIDHRFYRKRYDAALMLEQFARSARDEVETGSLVAQLLATINETLGPETAVVWLKTGEE